MGLPSEMWQKPFFFITLITIAMNSSGGTFRKPPRKPNEEEETKLSKIVTPNRHPPNFKEEETLRSDSRVTPEQAPLSLRKNFCQESEDKILTRRRKKILRNKSRVTRESARGGGAILN